MKFLIAGWGQTENNVRSKSNVKKKLEVCLMFIDNTEFCCDKISILLDPD